MRTLSYAISLLTEHRQISKIGANAGIVYNADLPGPANRLVWDAANVQEGDNALYRW